MGKDLRHDTYYLSGACSEIPSVPIAWLRVCMSKFPSIVCYLFLTFVDMLARILVASKHARTQPQAASRAKFGYSGRAEPLASSYSCPLLIPRTIV